MALQERKLRTKKQVDYSMMLSPPEFYCREMYTKQDTLKNLKSFSERKPQNETPVKRNLRVRNKTNYSDLTSPEYILNGNRSQKQLKKINDLELIKKDNSFKKSHYEEIYLIEDFNLDVETNSRILYEQKKQSLDQYSRNNLKKSILNEDELRNILESPKKTPTKRKSVIINNGISPKSFKSNKEFVKENQEPEKLLKQKAINLDSDSELNLSDEIYLTITPTKCSKKDIHDSDNLNSNRKSTLRTPKPIQIKNDRCDLENKNLSEILQRRAVVNLDKNSKINTTPKSLNERKIEKNQKVRRSLQKSFSCLKSEIKQSIEKDTLNLENVSKVRRSLRQSLRTPKQEGVYINSKNKSVSNKKQLKRNVFQESQSDFEDSDYNPFSDNSDVDSNFNPLSDSSSDSEFESDLFSDEETENKCCVRNKVSNKSINLSSSKRNKTNQSRRTDQEFNSSNEFETPKKITTKNKKCETTPRTRKNLEEINEKIGSFKLNATPKSIFKLVKSPKSQKSKRKSFSIKRVSFINNSALKRTKGVDENDGTNIERARRQLHVSAVPNCLPCRTNEYRDIYNFIYGKLSDNCSGCMYIAGVPGTGKTATVTEVVRSLKELTDVDDDLPNFKYLEINGMRLSEPRQTYVEILKQITGEVLFWNQAYENLKNFFLKKKQKEHTVLLIDELDILYTKRQDVIYNVLDWPTQTNSKLIVIAISNTMDLPERLLMGRVSSRLGLTRLSFQPYTYQQLYEIIISRLNQNYCFNTDAIQLVARKVAAVSGDARRALDICRRAADIKQSISPNESLVSLKHVNLALKEMFSTDEIVIIKNLTQLEKLFLNSILAEIHRTGIEEVLYDSVLKQLSALCVYENLMKPSLTILKLICTSLAKQKILSFDLKGPAINQLHLNINQDDIQYALKDN